MSYTNHLKTIMAALHSLLIGEFGFPVVQENEFKNNFSKDEYLQYWISEQNLLSLNSDGEDREYIFEINIYFNNRILDMKLLRDRIAARAEQLKQLVSENRTYQPDGVYKWHDARLETIEIEKQEDEPFLFYVHSELRLRRFNQWA